MKQRKLPNKLKQDIEKYYLSGIKPKDIIESLELDDDQVIQFGYMVYGHDKSGESPECLFYKRKELLNNGQDDIPSVAQYRTVKSHIIDSVQASALVKLKRKIDSLSEHDIESVSDIKIITDIFASLDKIGRLERGESTENINIESGLTLRDIENGRPIEVRNEQEDYDYRIEEDNTSEEERTLPNGVRLQVTHQRD